MLFSLAAVDTTPFFVRYDRGEGASVDGDGGGSHRAPAGRFRSFIEKSVGETESSRGRRRLLRDVGGSEKDSGKMAHSRRRVREREKGRRRRRRRPSTDFFAGKEKPSISPSKMTIRRGWLGKRLFIAHIQRSVALVYVFRTEFDEARRTRQPPSRNKKSLYKNCNIHSNVSFCGFCYL